MILLTCRSHAILIAAVTKNISIPSLTFSRSVTQYVGGDGKSFPLLFSKLEKNFPDLGKNVLVVFIYGLTFSFKMRKLRVSRLNTSTMLSRGVFLSCVIDEMFMKLTLFQKISTAWNYSWLCPQLITILSKKNNFSNKNKDLSNLNLALAKTVANASFQICFIRNGDY